MGPYSYVLTKYLSRTIIELGAPYLMVLQGMREDEVDESGAGQFTSDVPIIPFTFRYTPTCAPDLFTMSGRPSRSMSMNIYSDEEDHETIFLAEYVKH